MADADAGQDADHGLLVRRDGAVLRLVLDRPQARNALTPGLADRLAGVLEDTVADDDVRVVVLTGSGGAFSAGADVGEGSAALDEAAVERANRIVRAVVRLDKPVVASVNGVAAGFGCSLALAADLVLAAESASFLLPFTRLGLMPDGGATTTLAASLGRARTMRLALLAEPLPA
ncbi:enoyl-CoA hydratase-related protein, partial [Nocardioides sp. GCM10027113]